MASLNNSNTATTTSTRVMKKPAAKVGSKAKTNAKTPSSKATSTKAPRQKTTTTKASRPSAGKNTTETTKMNGSVKPAPKRKAEEDGGNAQVTKKAKSATVLKTTTKNNIKPVVKHKTVEDKAVVQESKKVKPAAAPKKAALKKATEAKQSSVASKPKYVEPAYARDVINTRATDRLDIYVFGGGEMGELGLGSEKGSVNVKRPRLNRNLDAQTVGIVNIAIGGMHTIALTFDNRIITWGINDSLALGRDTTWDGGLKDMDDNKSDSSSDSGAVELNPHEATPGDVSKDLFPPDTVFTKVAASDNASFVLTDKGLVYGWGTFRSNDGVFGFLAQNVKQKKHIIQATPVLIEGLKKIKDITCGNNHVLALDVDGNVFAWGNGQAGQLGRRINERHQAAALNPTSVALPKKKIVSIAAGSYHSFAIDKNDKVWAWGLNSFGELGIIRGAGEDSASVHVPTKVDSLADRGVSMVSSGSHHTAALTKAGQCLMFGRMDGGQIGIAQSKLPMDDEEKVLRSESGRPGALLEPTAVPGIDGAFVALGSDHAVLIAKDGKAYSWGFGGTFQLGLGEDEDVDEVTLIDNTAVRDKKMVWAGAGGQFSVLASKHT